MLDSRTGPQITEDRTSIDVFAVTHIDHDHVWGLDSLYDAGYEVQHVIEPAIDRYEIIDPETGTPEQGVNPDILADYEASLEMHGVREADITRVSAGTALPSELSTDADILSPPSIAGSVGVTRPATGADVEFQAKRANENGTVVKIEAERTALFMGDVQDSTNHHAESWLIQQHDDPGSAIDLDADLLFVGHHGSGNATSEEFLDRVEPETAVISSELNGPYDHPHDEVLENLHEHDVDVYWTAGHGTVRTDLDAALTTAQTTDLDTTNAANIAALKHYCREHDVSPDQIKALTPEHLPEQTPEWVADAAPMLVETTEEIVDTAVANADTVEDVRYTLDATPDAHEQLQQRVEADREKHVTTRQDAQQNKEAYFSAKRAERAYRQLPLHTRVRANLPNKYGGIDHPLQDVPAPDDLDGPRDVSEVPRAVKKPTAAEQRGRGRLVASEIKAAEESADSAVETATRSDALCRSLRATPGAHKDFLHAIETENAHNKHRSDKDLSDLLEQSNQKQAQQTNKQANTNDQDVSLGL